MGTHSKRTSMESVFVDFRSPIYHRDWHEFLESGSFCEGAHNLGTVIIWINSNNS